MNNRIKYTDFVETIRRSLVNVLGCSAEKIVFEQKKTGIDGEHDRLHITWSGDGMVKGCSIHIKSLYVEAMQQEMSIPEVISDILAQIERKENINNMSEMRKLEKLNDYEYAKDSMMVKLYEMERYAEELKGKVYIEKAGVAFVLCYFIKQDEDGIQAYTKINNAMLDVWGISKEKAIEDALINMKKKQPPRLYQIEKLFCDWSYNGEEFMNDYKRVIFNTSCYGNMISTDCKENGAVAIFYDGVAERIRECLGEDYFIVFTSIHESMIHAVSSTDAGTLRNVLEGTINEAVSMEEVLSRDIFYFNGKTNQILRLKEGVDYGIKRAAC